MPVSRFDRIDGLSLLLLVVAGGCFLALTLSAAQADYFSWDLAAAAWIQSIGLPGFEALMRAVSWPGTGWTPYWIVAATCLAAWALKRPWEAAICAAGSGCGALFNRLVKEWVDRPRPEEGLVEVLIRYPNESFPSGHVSLYVEFFGFLAYLFWVRRLAGGRIAAASAAAMVLAVGPSRVFLGAHWPSDVIGGYCGGIFWLSIMVAVYERRRR